MPQSKSKTKKNEPVGQNVEIFEEDRIITLNNDKNESVDFFEVACVEHEGEFYSLLQPVELVEGIADDEVLIFKLTEDPDNEDTDLFSPVDNEDILDAVFEDYLRKASLMESE